MSKRQNLEESLDERLDEIDKLNDQMSRFQLDEDDYVDSYNEIYGGDIELGGQTFDAWYAFKRLDELAYNIDLTEFVDGMDKTQHKDYKVLEEELQEAEEMKDLIEESLEELGEEEED
jgi:hypothetical protein